MWEKPDTFAVKKKKQKRALRVLNSLEKAEHYIADQPDPSGLSIETRTGARTRCEGTTAMLQIFVNAWECKMANKTRKPIIGFIRISLRCGQRTQRGIARMDLGDTNKTN